MPSGTVNLDGFFAQLKETRLPSAPARRRIRERAGVSARRVAQACGVSTSTVIAWEEGTTPRPEHAAIYRKVLDGLEQLA